MSHATASEKDNRIAALEKLLREREETIRRLNRRAQESEAAMARWARAETVLEKTAQFVHEQGRRLRSLYRAERGDIKEQERIWKDVVQGKNKTIEELKAALAAARAATVNDRVVQLEFELAALRTALELKDIQKEESKG